MSFVYLFILATGQVSERLKVVFLHRDILKCIYIHELLIFWLYNLSIGSMSFYF